LIKQVRQTDSALSKLEIWTIRRLLWMHKQIRGTKTWCNVGLCNLAQHSGENTKISQLRAHVFGTPHAGPTEHAKVFFGKICARVANKVIGDPKNDIMQALEKNSLFSDVLQENWRHHLENYKIVSFYEGIGDASSSLLYLVQH
jgi:hypothetical protein